MAHSQAWTWTIGLAACCLLLIAPSAGWAADEATEAEVQAELERTQQATAETLEQLQQAREQLQQIEIKRAAMLDEIRRASQRLRETEREADAAR